MKNSQVKEIYDQIELDEFSKERMYQKIKEKAYIKTNEKRKMWNYKKITSLVAMCVCAIIIFANPGVQAKMQEYANNLANWITGNSKNDYLDEVNNTVHNNNMSLTIISAQRVENEVRLKYEITFPKNIENFINLDDYGYKEYKDEYEEYGYTKRVFESDIFEDCKIYINNISIGDINNAEGNINESSWSTEVRDIDVKDNKLVQELIVMLENQYKTEDINFKFEFNKFKIDDEILTANLKAEYTLKGGVYSNKEIDVKPIKYTVKLNTNATYNFYGYSYTRTGIKIYAECENSTDEDPVTFFIATDNYGTKYLMYPIYKEKNEENKDYNEDNQLLSIVNNGKEKNIAVYEIYDGPADYDNQYQDYFNENITSLNLEFMTESYDENAPRYTVLNKVSEFKINFEENNE